MSTMSYLEDRKASSAELGRVWVVLAALLGALSVAAGGLGLVLWLAPQSLISLWPGFSPAVVAAVRQGLKVDDIPSAIGNDPSNAGLYAALAQSRMRAGDAAGADGPTRTAARLSRHESWSHLRLFMQALDRDDGAVAIQHLDTLLRTDPAIVNALLGAAALRGWKAGFVNDLAAALALLPPWRARLISWISEKEPQLSVGIRLAGLMQSGAAPLTNAELAPLLWRMTRASQGRAAYELWRAALPGDRKALIGAIYDPGWQTEPEGSPFEWRKSDDPDVTVTFMPGPGGGRIASLDILRGIRAAPMLSQVLVLDPGRWSFEGRVEMRGIDAARGLNWSVTCLGGQVLGSHKPLSGTFGSQAVSFVFDVPEKDCPVQSLDFMVYAAVQADARFGGSINLASPALTRQD